MQFLVQIVKILYLNSLKQTLLLFIVKTFGVEILK